MISREMFTEFFAVLLAWASKTDPNGLLEQVYWDQMQATQPSESELWDAISAYIDGGRGWPNAQDLKRHVWDERKRNQPQILPAEIPPVQDVNAFRLTIAACAYKTQGDTRFYRSLLTPCPSVMGVELPGKGLAIAHEQVLASLGLEVEDAA
jgi:hypothetical protein